MEIIGGLIIALMIASILAIMFGGEQSSSKTSTMPTISCPSGFFPSIAFKEKFREAGIAYDEKPKAICMLQPDTQDSQIISYQNILATAVFEDDILTAKSMRTDDPGKQLLSNILSGEMKVIFQDNTEPAEGEQPTISGGTSSNIQLRIFINDPAQPVHQIHFLNMEAKRGGVIHNEAVALVKNWQDLLSYLIRLASKPEAQPGQIQQPTSQQPTSQQQPEPAEVGNS